MKKITCALGLIALSCWPAWGQNQEVLITGTETGRQLGEEAFLLELLTNAHGPLRIGLLPLQSLTPKSPDLNALQQELPEVLNTQTGQAWKNLSQSPQKVFNQSLIEIADAQKLDAILLLEVQANDSNYWILSNYYSGANGEVLASKKISLPELSAEALGREIQKLLKSHPDPRIHDMDTPGNSELRVRTIPEGLYVYLDNQAVGLSPLIIRNVSAGSHELKLSEHQDYTIQKLQIVSTPPGVNVSWNKEFVGQTPVNLDPSYRQSGRHTLNLSHIEDFEAEIRIQTEPEGLKVHLDDLPIQRTPVSFQELDKSEYILEIEPLISSTMTLPLEIKPQSLQVQNINAYKYSRLIIDTSVTNARVEIDGEYVGETPFTTQLPQGEHHIEISKNRYRDVEKTLVLEAGETRELNLKLDPRSADTSIFLTPTGELTPQLNIAAKYLGFGNIVRNENEELSHLYGVEIDYGWPNLYTFDQTFELGFEISAFMYALQSASFWRPFPGLGAKLQFLREGDRIPISAALGAYASLNPNRGQLVGYLSLSRNFGDFALHLGLQTHGFNLNFGYTGWENVRIGALVYSDAFLNLLAEENESSTTFFGAQLGYSF